MHSLYTITLLAVTLTLVQAQGTIDVPQENQEFMRVHGTGSYNYICENGKYVLRDAQGDLKQPTQLSVPVGTFYFNRLPNTDQVTALFGINGPAVTFRLDTTQPANNPASLPNARYSITQSPTLGPLQGVSFAQSINTDSDAVPTNQCVVGDTRQIIFNTDFVFFRPGSYIPPTTTTSSDLFPLNTDFRSIGYGPPSSTTNTIPTNTESSSIGYGYDPSMSSSTLPTPSGTYSILPVPNPTQFIPQEIAVPPFNTELFSVRGAGTYNYVCQNNDWQLTNLFGELFRADDQSVLIGSLFVTPNPDARGGRIVFEVSGGQATFIQVNTAPSDTFNSIPKALFATTSVTPGTLNQVSFVQRLNTVGGTRPSATCKGNESVRVPFTANYVFYAKSDPALSRTADPFNNNRSA